MTSTSQQQSSSPSQHRNIVLAFVQGKMKQSGIKMRNSKFAQLQDEIFNLDSTETINAEWRVSSFKAFYKGVAEKGDDRTSGETPSGRWRGYTSSPGKTKEIKSSRKESKPFAN